jgi:hypothetical protein
VSFLQRARHRGTRAHGLDGCSLPVPSPPQVSHKQLIPVVEGEYPSSAPERSPWHRGVMEAASAADAAPALACSVRRRTRLASGGGHARRSFDENYLPPPASQRVPRRASERHAGFRLRRCRTVACFPLRVPSTRVRWDRTCAAHPQHRLAIGGRPAPGPRRGATYAREPARNPDAEG